MKRIINLLTTCALAFPVFMAVGCSGNSGEEEPVGNEVSLEASKTSVVANGNDQVTFTVKSDGKDVTASAKISCTDPSGEEKELENATFSTKTAGDYTFAATYDSRTSKTVKVTAVEEKYFRRVCVMDITGTWCTNCPAAGQTLEMLAQNRPDRMVILAVHGDGPAEKDPMTTPVMDMLDKMFTISGFPSVVVDLRESIDNAGLSSGVIDAYDLSREEYPATCGLRVESSYNESTGKIDITVGITSNTGGEYRLAAIILEDGITAKQIQDGYEKPDFKHFNVVRKLLSSNLVGDSAGTLEADKEKTMEFSTEVDSEWVVDNLRVAVYATDSSGFINNIVECKAKTAPATISTTNNY